MKKYKSTGLVYGQLWGGGEGAYPAEKLETKTREALVKKAEEMLDGRLDSGMGFQYLLGALLTIEEVETIHHNGKDYSRSEFEDVFIGDLTDEQADFLLEASLYY